MIAGRLKYAVLHLDDLAAIEAQGQKLNILLAMKNTNPTSHIVWPASHWFTTSESATADNGE